MKRRLEIARGFLHTPKILFLDEPTLGLDPQTRNQLWTQVKALNEQEGVTVFLTTHYMDEAERVAQRIAIIDHGKIVAQGTAAELKQQTGTESLEQALPQADGHVDPIRDGHERRRDARRWRPCGSEGGGKCVIYVLWLRQIKRYFRSRARIVGSLGQPLLFLLVARIRLRPVFQQRRPGQLHPVPRAGRHRDDACSSRRIFNGIELIWDRQFGFLKETLVAPGAARHDHDRPHARRRDDRPMMQGLIVVDRLPHRRLPAEQRDGRCRARSCSWR